MTNRVNWWEVSFDSEHAQAVESAIKNRCISEGPLTREFEREVATFLGVQFVVATTSGSVALYLALKSAGIGPGDEVIVPDRTWVATAHAVQLAGGVVKLVDVEARIPVVSLDTLEQAVSEQTKAIVLVHLNGRAGNIAEIKSFASQTGLTLIEDACQAFGSSTIGGSLGTQGDLGCFSLGMTKLISSGQGGLVVTNDEQMDKKIRKLKTHGVVDNFTETWDEFGFNFKFTDIQASLALVELSRIDQKIKSLKTLYRNYESVVADCRGLELLPVASENGEIPLYIEALASNRERMLERLSGEGIQCRPFLPCLHRSEYFDRSGDLKNSKLFEKHGVFLPSGPNQSTTTPTEIYRILSS